MFTFTEADVYKRYTPRYRTVRAAAKELNLRPAALDKKKTLLLNIDNGQDFDYPDGALPVAGALEDAARLLKWIYANPEEITDILSISDAHPERAIFFANWWVDAEGNHPAPYTVISEEDVASGVWSPVFHQEWSREYVKTLARTGKKQLTIWPPHSLIGTIGQKMLPAVEEAITFLVAGRGSRHYEEEKGVTGRTEHYGAFWAEVADPNHLKETAPNERLLTLPAIYERVFVTGQAKSHCVGESLWQYASFWADNPEVIRRVYFLTDTSSMIRGYEKETYELMNRLSERGVQMVTTDEL